MKIEKLMSRPVRTCSPDDQLTCAAQIMWETDVGCVPIVDGDNRVIGMITDRDIAMAAYTQGRALDGIPVASVMSKQVFSCSPKEDLARAEERMRQHQVRRLPVVDSAGVLEAAHATGGRKAEVQLDQVALTLAGISQHRHEGLTTSH